MKYLARCDGSYAEYATAGEDDFAVLDMKEPEPRPETVKQLPEPDGQA